MAIQYYMRAFNTSLSQYVDWIVNDAPDTSGTFSGYPTNQLTNIIVNRVVNSKVANFLKSNQSLGGFDGYYFHVNSYDWLKATSPINPPATVVGFAVERGISSLANVSAATNATPIQITSSSPHGLSTGALVTITGVQGNVAANGTFPVTVVNTNNFTLNGSQGSGTYTSGGTIYLPNNFSTLTWDEASNQWRFVVNTNGNGTTLGSSQNLRTLNEFIDGYASLGTTNHGGTAQATTGTIRIPNNQYMVGRSASSSSNIQLIGVDTLDRIKIGSGVSNLVYTPGSVIVDGYVVHDGTGSNVATTGFIREQNNTNIIAFRDQSNLNDIVALSSTSANKIVLGDAVNTGINYNTLGLHSFQTNSFTNVEIANSFIRFTPDVVAPIILQATPIAGVNGQTLTIKAQNGGTGSTTGGIANISSGSGGSFNGTVDLSTGGTVKLRIHPTTTSLAVNANSIQLFENKIRFDSAQILPRITQDDVNITSTNGQAMYFIAQNAIGSNSNGGNAVISSGTGTNSAGNVILQTGGVNQVIISPTQTTVLGNLLVHGTTTSVASTVVEMADRVINLNSSADVYPSNVAVPSQITGFAVDRGTTSTPVAGTKRDYYGLFWVESDSCWKFAANTDGYTTQVALAQNLPVMGSYYVAQPNAAITAGTIPTVGSFRALNNVTALSSRKNDGSANLRLVRTNTSDQILWGDSTNNAGHVFDTSTGTLYDFSINGTTMYRLTPVVSGAMTLEAQANAASVVYSHKTTTDPAGGDTTLRAQNAVTTGGNLNLSSGNAVTDGNIRLQTGGNTKVAVHPTYTEFRDSSNEMYRITPSSGTTTLQASINTTNILYNHADLATASATAGTTTIQAQNAIGATSTGGNLTLSSGTGTTAAGNVRIQTGAVDRVVVHPTYTEFRDTAEAVRITPVSSGITQMLFASTVTGISFSQVATASATGANFNIIAQGATTTGGSINLETGTGTTNGSINLKVASTLTASVVPNKFVNNQGRRRHVTQITSAANYNVLASDDFIAITSLSATFNIVLPATPTLGDIYEIKDTTGNADTFPVTVDGNGNNIDGAGDFDFTQSYGSASFIWTGTQWSII